MTDDWRVYEVEGSFSFEYPAEWEPYEVQAHSNTRILHGFNTPNGFLMFSVVVRGENQQSLAEYYVRIRGRGVPTDSHYTLDFGCVQAIEVPLGRDKRSYLIQHNGVVFTVQTRVNADFNETDVVSLVQSFRAE